MAHQLRQGDLAAFAADLAALPAQANLQVHSCPLRRFPALVRQRWLERLQQLQALSVDLNRCSEQELMAESRPLFALLEQDLLLCPRRRGPWSLDAVSYTHLTLPTIYSV